VITGYSTIASAVETMKLGAFDYLPKPFTPEEMLAVTAKAWEKRKLVLESRAVAAGEPVEHLANLVGRSQKMQEVYNLIRKVAPTNSTVLIVGGSGTGKELVARAIHSLSLRNTQRFFAIDCGTLSVELLESELFGHVRGAFTGAVMTKKESSKRRTMARSFSMRSATSGWKSRASCCASSRNANFFPWAAQNPGVSMSA